MLTRALPVTGAELDFLSMDPVEPLSSGDDDADASRPYRPDVSLNYTARLVSKFLLSFTDDRYIFDQQP